MVPPWLLELAAWVRARRARAAATTPAEATPPLPGVRPWESRGRTTVGRLVAFVDPRTRELIDAIVREYDEDLRLLADPEDRPERDAPPGEGL